MWRGQLGEAMPQLERPSHWEKCLGTVRVSGEEQVSPWHSGAWDSAAVQAWELQSRKGVSERPFQSLNVPAAASLGGLLSRQLWVVIKSACASACEEETEVDPPLRLELGCIGSSGLLY